MTSLLPFSPLPFAVAVLTFSCCCLFRSWVDCHVASTAPHAKLSRLDVTCTTAGDRKSDDPTSIKQRPEEAEPYKVIAAFLRMTFSGRRYRAVTASFFLRFTASRRLPVA